jgi:hypothetical protein
MQGCIPEIAEMAGSNGKTIILLMDQSKIADGFECLILSIRTGQRALPLTGEVREISGSIGFERRKPLLDAAFALLPEGAFPSPSGRPFLGHGGTNPLVPGAWLGLPPAAEGKAGSSSCGWRTDHRRSSEGRTHCAAKRLPG